MTYVCLQGFQKKKAKGLAKIALTDIFSIAFGSFFLTFYVPVNLNMYNVRSDKKVFNSGCYENNFVIGLNLSF